MSMNLKPTANVSTRSDGSSKQTVASLSAQSGDAADAASTVTPVAVAVLIAGSF
jgi:hypothetical protein